MTVVTIGIASGAKDGIAVMEGTGGTGWPPAGGTEATGATTDWDAFGIYARKVRSASFGFTEATTGHLIFDTSSLPDDADISDAYLEFVVQTTALGETRDLEFDWHDHGAGIDMTDWTISVGSSAAAVPFSTWSAWAANGTVQVTLTDPAANIDLSGETGIRIGMSGGAPPEGVDSDTHIAIRPFENATYNEPRLVITYTEPDQNVSATGLGSSSAFGTATAVPGGVTASATGLGSSSAFGMPTVDSGDITVQAPGLASASAFGTPTVVPGGVEVAATGLDSASSFGTPAVNQAVPATGLGSSSAFGTPTVVAGGTTIQAPGLGSASQFGNPTTDGGEPPTFSPAIHGGKHR